MAGAKADKPWAFLILLPEASRKKYYHMRTYSHLGRGVLMQYLRQIAIKYIDDLYSENTNLHLSGGRSDNGFIVPSATLVEYKHSLGAEPSAKQTADPTISEGIRDGPKEVNCQFIKRFERKEFRVKSEFKTKEVVWPMANFSET